MLAPAGNYIASPLGVWVLLAQLTGANAAGLSEAEHWQAERTLRMDVARAFALSTSLLRGVPEAIRLACAAWVDNSRAEVHKEWLWGMRRGQAAEVEEHLPTQVELDSWAAKNTLNMIKKFPLDLSPDAFFVLATAIATKISWDKTFEAIEAENSWGVSALLHENNLHQTYLVEDDQRRPYAVHMARGSKLEVFSVIAEDPAVPEAEVLAFAEKLANDQIFPTHLPRAGSPLYTFEAKRGQHDTYEVWLPAWSAKSELDLTKADLHLPELVKSAVVKPEALAAAQSAYAKYSREGFEAAAVTGLIAMRASVSLPVIKDVLHYKIRFDHPYAVVARSGWSRDYPLWSNLPLFSGVVRTAEQPEG